MSSPNKGIAKAEVGVRWDPSPSGAPPHDLDIIAGTYLADAPEGPPAYLVHFDSRSPDGTIALQRDSLDGQGLGYDEIMTLELDRLDPRYVRVVVGVVIQQGNGRVVFGDVAAPGVRVREGYRVVLLHDFSSVAASTAAVVVEFVRDDGGQWQVRTEPRGYDVDPATFTDVMGRPAP